jgi:spermidine synthase
MLAHGAPKTVFIGGGGEGATAREVLRWKSVEKVVMCDIDETACQICRQQLPEWNTGVYEDKRWGIDTCFLTSCTCQKLWEAMQTSEKIENLQNCSIKKGGAQWAFLLPQQKILTLFSGARFEIHYEDALSFLSNWEGPKFDVVIMDICDPIEAGPGLALYFKEFYQAIARYRPASHSVCSCVESCSLLETAHFPHIPQF